ncbi:MAG: alpha/beta fold hydrolase, partial [Actinomycetota bacterium]
MESRTVDLGGPVHYIDFGGDGPALVLVHGLGGSHPNWLAVGPRLAERCRVFAPDLVGFGRTPPAGRPMNLQGHRDLIERFLDEVVGGPAILVGNSTGGVLSIIEAVAAPEKVAGLVLLDPALPRGPGARPDGVVVGAFAAYAVPGVGERFVRLRRKQLGPEGIFRE